jgi:hypothetical protein
MKKFVDKIQDLGHKAAQIKQAVESVPPKLAEVRDAVIATTGQLQQLRNDVQSTVSSLRAENDDRLIEALREIDDSTDTFREAGYDLDDVEMEIVMPQRLIVHLEKVSDVPATRLRSLLAANEGRRNTHAILVALIKAEEMANKVALTNLRYHKLMVYVGATPSVRLCWWAEPTVAEQPFAATSATQAGVAAPAPQPMAAPVSSLFGQGSFFERREPTPAIAVQPTSPVVATTLASRTSAAPAPASEPVSETPGDWRRDALERFKKMPDLSKPRR